MKNKGTNSNSNLDAAQAQGTTSINSPLTVSGNTTTITCTSPGYYSTSTVIGGSGDAWDWVAPKVDVSDESIKKIVEKIFDSDEDLMPLVKNYLVKYLDKVMDKPEEIVKELIKEKDEKINQLEEQVEAMNKKIVELEEKIERESRAFDLNGTNLGPTTKWIYKNSNATSAGGSWTTSTYDCYDGDNSSSTLYCSDLSSVATGSANIINSLASTVDKDANQAYTMKASYDALASKIEQKLNALNTTDVGS